MSDRTALTASGERDLLDFARDRLAEFGIAFEAELPDQPRNPGVDAIATLSRAGVTARYVIEVKGSMTLSALAGRSDSSSYPRLIVGDHVSRRSSAALRNAGVQFVDAQGNAFISFGTVLVDVQGRTKSIDPTTEGAHRAGSTRSSNLFSPGRAQVIFALLSWPELAAARIREIASAAGRSVGQTHEALQRLEEAGFLLAQSKRLTRADELLDFWTATYPAGLGRQLETSQYHGDLSKSVRSEKPFYLSGESAVGVDIVHPTTLTIYLDDEDAKLPILNRWSRRPDRRPNVFVRRKFWNSPHPSEEEPATHEGNAPWPLVYADLLATGDARLGEVARTWRSHNARFE